jgi:hypothetical protein
MARAKVNTDGTGVRVGLSFREAAALHALLLRVGPETHEGIDEATVSLAFALADVRDAVEQEDKSLWPKDFDAFADRDVPLEDPES